MKFTLLLCALFCGQFLFAQQENSNILNKPEKDAAVVLEFISGEIHSFNIDFEYKLNSKIALQAGVGNSAILSQTGGLQINSFDISLNYYFNKNSPYCSLFFLQQGFGNDFYASYLGPSFTVRLKRIFQMGLGFGFVISKNAEYNPDKNIGVFFNLGIFLPI